QSIPLTINGTNGISLGGANPGDFSLGNGCPVAPTTLSAGGTCFLTINFVPTAPGARQATLSVADDALGSPHTLILKGTGAPPVTISPVSITSFSAPVSTTSAYQTITITNAATNPNWLNFTDFKFIGPFQSTTNTCKDVYLNTLAPGAK